MGVVSSVANTASTVFPPSLDLDNEGSDTGGYDPNDGIPATSQSVHPAGIIMNSSHALAVGSRFGLFWITIRARSSCAQLALPVTSVFARLRKRPFLVIGKAERSHSVTSIAVAEGVVVTGDNPNTGSGMRGTEDFSCQKGCPPGIARFCQVGDDCGAILRMAESSHVFNDDPRWLDFRDKAVELIPETWNGRRGLPVSRCRVLLPKWHH